MEIAVVGAGSVGMTTAYRLAERGASVTVFDAADDVGHGASFGNGGQLSYSFADGLAEPALLRRLPAILLDQDPAIRARFLTSPTLWLWGLRFIANCLPARSRRNSAQLLELALRSAAVSQRLHRVLGDRYGYREAGKLVLLNQPADDAVKRQLAVKQAAGCDIQLLTSSQALCLEPAIAGLREPPAAALFGGSDAVGDARRYCSVLSSELAGLGGRVKLSTRVTELITEGHRVGGVRTDAGEHRAHIVVLCTGGLTNQLTASLGLKLPIYPVTGYSLTLPSGDAQDGQPLRRSLTLRDAKIVFSRIGDAVRIAGMADINLPPSAYPARIDALMQTAAREAPDLARYPSSDRWQAIVAQHRQLSSGNSPDSPAWIGHRPMTPSGLPIVGRTSIPGLVLNVGHGMLGWTLGAATADAVAGALTGSSLPEVA